MVDITITPDMSKEAVIELAHNVAAVPAMVSLYVVFGISLILAGWGFKDPESSWGRFFWIWTATMIIVGVFLVFFIFSPDTIQWIASGWNDMWT